MRGLFSSGWSRLAVIVALGLVGSCVGLFAVVPALERREVRRLFSRTPGIADLRLYGDYDVGVRAKFRTGSDGWLVLEDVTPDSFVRGASVCVARVGELQALATGCVASGDTTRPYWAHCLSSGADGLLGIVLGRPLAGVLDAAERYDELEEAFVRAPRCPEFLEVAAGNSRGSVRVCMYSAEAHWPDISPAANCERAA